MTNQERLTANNEKIAEITQTLNNKLVSVVDGSALPIGSVVVSTCKQKDASYHLADGSELAIGGTYDAFCKYIINNIDDFPHYNTIQEWQNDIDVTGQCGKYVVTDTYVKIPKITKMTESANSENELGQSMKAGLPNITGKLTNMYIKSGGSQTNGALSISGYIQTVPAGASSGGYNTFDFDASRSSQIYGNSTTVQPQTIKYYYYIVVGTVTKTDIEIDIDKVASDLNILSNVKADANASNLTPENISSWEEKLGITGHLQPLWSGNIAGNPLMTLSDNMFNYKWLIIYAIQDDTYRFGQVISPYFLQNTSNSYSTRYVISTDAKYATIYYVNDTKIQVAEHSSGTLWLVVRGVK